MTTVGSYAAKTHLPALLERAEKGERIIITRRGVPIAMLTQAPHTSSAKVRDAIAKMKALRKGNTLPKGVTIRDLINEGRRY